MKFARAATGRPSIVYRSHAFHGLSYGALSVNGDETFRSGFGPLLPNCIRVPFNDLPALEEVLTAGAAAAFIVEPIEGKVCVNMPADGYLRGAADLCRRYGTLFIVDEIQTGLGRTGRFLAVGHWNVEPDMVLISKALSRGHVPVSAVLTRKRVFDRVFDRMDRAMVAVTTFAENNLAMAAGIATLEVLESERLVEKAASIGKRLMRAFSQFIGRYELVREVRARAQWSRSNSVGHNPLISGPPGT
jgi:ornithine--oxo-acid transaminase